MTIKAVLFDKDGTLIDFNATWIGFARNMALAASNHDTQKAESLIEALGYDSSTGRFQSGSIMAAGSSRDVTQLLWPDLSENELQARIKWLDAEAATHGAQNAVPVPGTRACLDRLRAGGVVLGVGTNDSAHGARQTIASLGWNALFSHILGYDSVAAPKPSPDMVLAFAEAVGLPVSTIAMIGDNAHDIQAAQAAGAGMAIGVLSGTSVQADLAPYADVILDSVADLPEIIFENGIQK